MSVSWSIDTNGPLKHTGGGNIAQSAESAGGWGNDPPANGCSPWYEFFFGLYGIICEKSGRGSWFWFSKATLFIFAPKTPLVSV